MKWVISLKILQKIFKTQKNGEMAQLLSRECNWSTKQKE